MWIDINAYMGHWPFRQLHYNTCEKLLKRMDRFGVDVSVISNLNGIFYKNTQSANEELYEVLKTNRRFRSHFIPFAVINPTYANWREDFDTCISRMGMKGLRLYPKYHDYEITDPACIELVKRARDKGVPVAFNLRMVDSRQRSWMDIDHVAGTSKPEWSFRNILPLLKIVPDAKYMILNLANAATLTDEELDLVKKVNLVFDTSGRAINDMGLELSKYGKGKFAFGTHSPILDYITGQLRIASLPPDEADEQTKELLRSGNARRIIGV